MPNETARPSTTLRTVATAIGVMVKDGASYLADLLSRIVNGLAGIAPALLGAVGCQAGSVDAAVPPPAAPEVSIPVSEKSVVVEGPRPVGKFNITFYYVAGEDEVEASTAAKAAVKAATAAKAARLAANDNLAVASTDPVGELAAIVVPELVTIYQGDSCAPITEVSKDFAAQLALQGTGKLKDGRVLNVWGNCNCERSPCFKVTQSKWGTSGSGRPLQPFRTVAVDPKVVKLGTLLHVPLLEGRTMPGRAPWGGFVHDGCVVADDTGGGIRGNQLDLFVGRKGYYLGVSGSAGSHSWARQVPVFDGSKVCERNGRRVSRKAGAI